MEEVIGDLHWDDEKELYLMDNIGIKSGTFYAEHVESSLQKQGFSEATGVYQGNYDAVYRLVTNNGTVEYRREGSEAELDFGGARLTGLKEDPELMHSVQTGHFEDTSSIETLLDAEKNPSKTRLSDLNN